MGKGKQRIEISLGDYSQFSNYCLIEIIFGTFAASSSIDLCKIIVFLSSYLTLFSLVRTPPISVGRTLTGVTKEQGTHYTITK